MTALSTAPTCLVPGCPTQPASPAMGCPDHWAMVPAALRTSLIATHNPGADPTAEHAAYLTAARAEIAHKQKRCQGQGRRPVGKPVQLTLF